MLSDIVDAATRSRMMAGIRSTNTKPEMTVRHGLHHRGFRYRLHDRRLPGRPDLVLPRHRAAVFVHGCFWHGHDCPLFRWPRTREDFWRSKITGNQQRDRKNIAALKEANWRVLTIWECALRGTSEPAREALLDGAALWIESASSEKVLRGDHRGDC